MAIVTRFSQTTKDRVGRPKTTECGYSTVDVDGTRYLLVSDALACLQLCFHSSVLVG
jgi:hypothetical protein